MTFDPVDIVNRLESHAMASGYFDSVNGHEPKSMPGKGITCAVWADRLGPAAGASGLAATSGVLTMNVRVYSSMLAVSTEAMDAIDPNVLSAVSALMGAYSGDFELGGSVRNIDLLGAYSQGLVANAGYINMDGKLFRVMTIVVPMVINDMWTQAP